MCTFCTLYLIWTLLSSLLRTRRNRAQRVPRLCEDFKCYQRPTCRRESLCFSLNATNVLHVGESHYISQSLSYHCLTFVSTHVVLHIYNLPLLSDSLITDLKGFLFSHNVDAFDTMLEGTLLFTM